jgi:hypothetical protein
MARKYISVSVDVEAEVDIDNILCKVDTDDLLDELNTRRDLKYHLSKLKELALENFDDFELLKLNVIQEMKLKYLMEVLDKYSLNQIETLLP